MPYQIIKRVTHEAEPLDVRYDTGQSSIVAHRLTIELQSSDTAIDCKLLGEQLAQYIKQTRIE